MTSFVILAAGRGTRMGRVGASLHKCLTPLDGRAVLSHIIDLAPKDAQIVIAVGHRADQIDEYVRLAHPHLDITGVTVPNWDKPGGGPGASLLACRHLVDAEDGDLYVTSCDTVWSRDELLWQFPESWMGVATMPAGTTPSRWCRVIGRDRVEQILDKTPAHPEVNQAYVGLGHVARRSLSTFWDGILAGHLVTGERQVTNGFMQILAEGGSLRALHIDWTDVGDEDAYRDAVLRFSGYDWTKLGQATYVLPKEGRVVKFADDPEVIQRRVKRGDMLTGVPSICASGTTMLAYDYVPGPTVYEALRNHRDKSSTLVMELCDWYVKHFTQKLDVPRDEMEYHAMRFYRDKTFDRIAMLPEALRLRAMDAVSRINWQTLVHFTKPVRWHGDLNFGNIIVSANGFIGIDWREDFDGELGYGDMRYDIAKLLGGTVIHWQRAQTGDMRPWPEGEEYARIIREVITDDYWIEVIGGLTLLNSAPLHTSPLDEVLVARGCAWLERVMV